MINDRILVKNLDQLEGKVVLELVDLQRLVSSLLVALENPDVGSFKLHFVLG